MFYNLLRGLRYGTKAPDNPWGGTTLEWTIPSPPPVENFEEIPVITTGPYDHSHIHGQKDPGTLMQQETDSLKEEGTK